MQSYNRLLLGIQTAQPVDAHPISKGIRNIVTSKSAIVRCMSKRLTRVLVFLKSLISAINTMKLAIEPITNKVPYPTMWLAHQIVSRNLKLRIYDFFMKRSLFTYSYLINIWQMSWQPNKTSYGKVYFTEFIQNSISLNMGMIYFDLWPHEGC